MRLCRFNLDGTILAGYYSDDRVIAVDQAFGAFEEEHGGEPPVSIDDDLLHLLPPSGASMGQARRLWDWLESLPEDERSALEIPIQDVEILRPIERPGKLLMLAGNYAKHVEERGERASERAETFPYVFMKPTTTLIDPGRPIVIPSVSPDHVDWECELAVVIGATCRKVPESRALNFVAGYTVLNDVSDRSFRPNPGRKKREKDAFFDWLHGKWHDSFCPMGPCILSADDGVDPQDFRLRLIVNDRVHQDDSTASMVFPVAAVVSFISQVMTLEPGDVISTGTPSGVGSASNTYLKPGDAVSAGILGIGTLSNPVVAEVWGPAPVGPGGAISTSGRRVAIGSGP